MEIRQLEAFRAIATLGSFSAAAQKLYTTQPAISLRVQALEIELGAELFDRASRPARLTVTGHRLLRYAEQILDAANDIIRVVGGARGRISIARIGIPSALVSKWAPHLMAEIYKDNPQAKVELYIDRTSALRQAIENGEIDFALAIGPVDEANLVSIPIARYDYCWITDQKTAEEGKLKSIADVNGHIFTYSKTSSAFRALSDYLKGKGLTGVELCASNSTDAILHMISKGLGVGVVMATAIDPDSLNSHGIRQINLETDMIPSAEYWAIYRRDGDVLLGEYLVDVCISKEAKGLKETSNL